MIKEAAGLKLPTHKDNISNYRSSSIEKATDSELFEPPQIVRTAQKST